MNYFTLQSVSLFVLSFFIGAAIIATVRKSRGEGNKIDLFDLITGDNERLSISKVGMAVGLTMMTYAFVVIVNGGPLTKDLIVPFATIYVGFVGGVFVMGKFAPPPGSSEKAKDS